MGNPLLDFWLRLLTDRDSLEREPDRRDERGNGDGEPHAAAEGLPGAAGEQATSGILLMLRRMRVPLVVLIVIFAVSVLGLTLVPGVDENGDPHRLSIFEAFYFMSFTATTIGFGELPHPFTPAQRMWVTFSIFLSVIGWAYAIGSLLSLVQDRAFRRSLDRRLFARKVAHLGEPFWLLVGYGETARRIARSLDELGRRFVVLDSHEDRVASVDLDAHQADAPALVGDPRSTEVLTLAGLGQPHCEGVLALSDNDAVNLDVAMTTSLVRPTLPVIAQTGSMEVEERMRAFGSPVVINPVDRFGDHLRILHRSPAAYQLMMWLTSPPGAELPPRRAPLPRGRWVVCGYDAFGRDVTADLRAEGVEVTVVERDPVPGGAGEFGAVALDSADVAHAVAFIAATNNDMTNLWLVESARRLNPDAFLVARQNTSDNQALYDAVGIDFGMVRADVVAHEVMARLANPDLMRLLPRVPRLGEEWAASMVEALVERGGTRTPHLWSVDLTAEGAPALLPWLAEGSLRLGDLLRTPQARDRPLPVVALALVSGEEATPGPPGDSVLAEGDRLLLAGSSPARRSLDATLSQEVTAAYVLDDRHLASTWLWRRFTRTAATRSPGSG
jgi:Trk K+ transport system NAD-binding subunit